MVSTYRSSLSPHPWLPVPTMSLVKRGDLFFTRHRLKCGILPLRGLTRSHSRKITGHLQWHVCEQSVWNLVRRSPMRI